MAREPDFDLKEFVPYLLNQAAEETSRGFATYYKARYGMLRTEWRVVFHLGHYGPLTAREICCRARLHKTKVSRAVQALEEKRFLARTTCNADRRLEMLSLTSDGRRAFEDLVREARQFDRQLLHGFSDHERTQIRRLLSRLAGLT